MLIPRGQVPLTRHFCVFEIPVAQSTESDLRNPDKALLRTELLAMRGQALSYRKIGTAPGIHYISLRSQGQCPALTCPDCE